VCVATCALDILRISALCASRFRGRICMHTRTHARTHAHARARTHTRTNTSTHAHTQAHTHTHTRMRTHTHTRTHARTHIRAPYCSLACPSDSLPPPPLPQQVPRPHLHGFNWSNGLSRPLVKLVKIIESGSGEPSRYRLIYGIWSRLSVQPI
jgi:hypothetical protein